jgi:predicted dinucleotide-binding enzyme
VRLVHPDADPARALAEELRQRFPDGECDWAASAEAADVTVLALWYDAALQVARSSGAGLGGHLQPHRRLDHGWAGDTPDSSAAEEIQQIVGTDVKVVKAFNTTFAGPLTTGEGHDFPLDVLIAGDDSAAKDKIADFVAHLPPAAPPVGPAKLDQILS